MCVCVYKHTLILTRMWAKARIISPFPKSHLYLCPYYCTIGSLRVFFVLFFVSDIRREENSPRNTILQSLFEHDPSMLVWTWPWCYQICGSNCFPSHFNSSGQLLQWSSSNWPQSSCFSLYKNPTYKQHKESRWGPLAFTVAHKPVSNVAPSPDCVLQNWSQRLHSSYTKTSWGPVRLGWETGWGPTYSKSSQGRDSQPRLPMLSHEGSDSC